MKVHPLISRIRSLLWREDNNFILVVKGKTGSGKSESAIRLAQLIDHKFT